jgi:hypothetical protein
VIADYINRVDSLRRAATVELDLNEKETKTLRSRIYAINKDGIRKYRTIREAGMLVIWRIK